ncbi:protein kinase [Streptomyces sp. NPDC005648]|uniref:serine/threonine-protein kinase n=1 Tax=Streptomyces sp. NPDC005648 TaxID=3157044 RepID=UPI0033BC9E22
MGRVWRATDEMLDRSVAVKEMRIDGLDAEDTRTRRERTLREARATARIDHPNVVRVYDVVDEGERLWIVMELVVGRSLERMMVEDGPLAPRETARIGLGLVAALRQVHARGVLHRDIKPGNVLVESAAAYRIVLTDFGIAAIQDAKALTMVGMLVGSPDYMAPERVSGRPQGPPSDIWSLGATLCAALGGRSPFSRDTTLATLHAVLYEEPEIPSSAGPLSDVLAALLEKDPSVRPSLHDVSEALRPIAFPPTMPTIPVGGGAGEGGAGTGGGADRKTRFGAGSGNPATPLSGRPGQDGTEGSPEPEPTPSDGPAFAPDPASDPASDPDPDPETRPTPYPSAGRSSRAAGPVSRGGRSDGVGPAAEAEPTGGSGAEAGAGPGTKSEPIHGSGHHPSAAPTAPTTEPPSRPTPARNAKAEHTADTTPLSDPPEATAPTTPTPPPTSHSSEDAAPATPAPQPPEAAPAPAPAPTSVPQPSEAVSPPASVPPPSEAAGSAVTPTPRPSEPSEPSDDPVPPFPWSSSEAPTPSYLGTRLVRAARDPRRSDPVEDTPPQDRPPTHDFDSRPRTSVPQPTSVQDAPSEAPAPPPPPAPSTDAPARPASQTTAATASGAAFPASNASTEVPSELRSDVRSENPSVPTPHPATQLPAHSTDPHHTGVSLIRAQAVTQPRPIRENGAATRRSAPHPPQTPNPPLNPSPTSQPRLPHDPPAPRPHRTPEAEPHAPRRRTALLAGVGLLAAAGVVVAAVLFSHSGSPGHDKAGSPGSTTTPASSAPTVDGTARPPSTPPGTVDESGLFSWVPPKGWKRTVLSGSSVQYTSPDGNQEIVGRASLATKGTTLLQNWQQEEAAHTSKGAGYQRIRLRETTFKGRPAVEWEYLVDVQGAPWHTRLLGFRKGKMSYEISTWYRPDTESTALPVYDRVRDTFTPQ